MTTTLQGQPIDERTDVVALPLPHINNWHEDDVPRLRLAFELIDAAVQLLSMELDTKADQTALQALSQASAQQLATLASNVALLAQGAARPTNVVYGYDAQGRVSTVTATVAGVPRLTTFTYDAQGRLATASYPVAGGATRTETFNYDAATGRVSGVSAMEAP